MNARQRTQIRALADGTRTYQDIADAMDMPREQVRAALRRYKLTALRSRPTPGRRIVPARRDIVRALADGTRTSAELAAAAGVSVSYASHMARCDKGADHRGPHQSTPSRVRWTTSARKLGPCPWCDSTEQADGGHACADGPAAKAWNDPGRWKRLRQEPA